MNNPEWRHLVANAVIFIVLVSFLRFCICAPLPWPLMWPGSGEEPVRLRLQKLKDELDAAERQLEELKRRCKK